jgi:uncharacterized damage-inducible protein DinB
MIKIPDLKRMLKMENSLIHEQTNGLSQEDSLVQPPSGGNCMNWVLGHLLDNQITLLNLLGGQPPFDPARLERYRRESDPIRAQEEGVLELNQLLTDHDQVLVAISTRLGEMSETDFDQEILQGERRVTVGWRLFFLHFHYTYHLGQLELLRQMAGKTEKII